MSFFVTLLYLYLSEVHTSHNVLSAVCLHCTLVIHRRNRGCALGVAEVVGAALKVAQVEGGARKVSEVHGGALGVGEVDGGALKVAGVQGDARRVEEVEGGACGVAEAEGGALKAAEVEGGARRVAEVYGGALRVAGVQGGARKVAEVEGATLGVAEVEGGAFTLFLCYRGAFYQPHLTNHRLSCCSNSCSRRRSSYESRLPPPSGGFMFSMSLVVMSGARENFLLKAPMMSCAGMPIPVKDNMKCFMSDVRSVILFLYAWTISSNGSWLCSNCTTVPSCHRPLLCFLTFIL